MSKRWTTGGSDSEEETSEGCVLVESPSWKVDGEGTGDMGEYEEREEEEVGPLSLALRSVLR